MEAETSLRELIQKRKLSPLYTSENDGLEGAKRTIQEVLAQDPRAIKKRGTTDNNAVDAYKIILCTVQVEFVVLGEGAVQVIRISPVDFNDATYVDGVPLAVGGTITG